MQKILQLSSLFFPTPSSSMVVIQGMISFKKMVIFVLYSQIYLNFWYFLFVFKDLSFCCSLKNYIYYF